VQKSTLYFATLKERQLLFLLTRQLAEAQFQRADQTRTEQLWQEAAALDLDPDRLIHLLYGVADYSDLQEMNQVDRAYQQRMGVHRQRWWTPALGRFTGKGGGAWHRSAPRAGSPARS
jgi:hypothetical protein